jgi:Alpha/beta hydrolase domain
MRLTAALFASLIACSASAEITRLEITSQRPFGSFRAGDYVLVEGKVHGDLAPDEPIPGLDRAARNARGRVEYAARIVLIVPTQPDRGNGTLLVDVPNRGNAYAIALYNSPRGQPFQSGTFEQGTGFLQDHGFSVAEVYWELGQGAELPAFTDAEGKRRYVEGVGFAIFRDAADFLAHAGADAGGNANPLRGSVRHLIATGKSQSGRFLKSFLMNGFNNVRGKPLFEGMHVFVSASGQLPIMQTGTGPESSANALPTFENPEMRGYTEEPAGLPQQLARGAAHGRLPKMLFINSTTDYYAIRSSLGRTGSSGTAEIALPPEARAYDIAGAAHAMVAKAPPSCTLKPGALDWAPVSRATLLRLDAWVASDTEPPPSLFMPLEPPGTQDALRAPAHMPNAVVLVPKRDADGNAIGGVRLPDMEAPLGTQLALNQPLSRPCMLIGGYRPFAATKAEREASADTRLSIEERYRNRDDYVNRIRVASRRLMDEGFLLPEDAAIIVEEAASSRAFAKAK